MGEGGGPVLVGEERWVVPDLKVKVDRLVGERRELVAEAELVCAVLGSGEGEAVVLLLYLLEERRAFRVFQAAVHVIMAAGHNLEEEGRGNNHNYRHSL